MIAGVDLPSKRRIHLVGVAGAGMSALAKLLHQARRPDGEGTWLISGSDLRAGLDLDALAAIGIETWSGHRPDRMGEMELVVASSAVPENDPELQAAARAGAIVWRRPDLLWAITAAVPTIGATGTHGKTTTTALLTLLMQALGFDPSFVIGGEMTDLGTNAHYGADPLFVLEVDEAFGTFERTRLAGLVVTNVEPEHLDYFGTAGKMEAAFERVARSVKGPVLACADDEGSRRLAKATGATTYGLSKEADWQIESLQTGAGSVDFELRSPQGMAYPVHVPQPGRHLASNAAGALALVGELGYDPEHASRGLTRFRGVKRRFELRGWVGGVTIIDDYAHHPTEVSATVAAGRLRLGSRPGSLVALFQPHLYSRTEALHREFGVALAAADLAIVTDVYGSRESPVPGVTGELISTAVAEAGGEVVYVPHRAEVVDVVAQLLHSGDLLLIMGAGDITHVAGEIAEQLARPAR
ncbi:UDP-N-acetylmuramate--L-alanine ligase [soil metagenome]